MPNRNRYTTRHRDRWDNWGRKQKKASYIHRKNQITAGNGFYYTDHVEDGQAVWLDFYFMSERYKGRYFSVAATTLEYIEHENDENLAFELVDATNPLPEDDMFPQFGPAEKMGKMKVYSMLDPSETRRKYYEMITETQEMLIEKPRTVRPSIEMHLDYGPVAIGMYASLNTKVLDEATVIDFIKMYRAMGEPITKGIVWTGEEVEVVPARLNTRQRFPGTALKDA